jgi:L-aminopeptidase/D-esterase-like protein
MITDVRGIRVGHWTDLEAATGCTVVLPPPGTIGSGEVRGGAPGTRETDLLRPGMLVEEVDAVLLTGGSAFGLAAADGVMRWLAERDVGFDAGIARVPIVPAAVLFDLGVGDPTARPGAAEGYAACQAAVGATAEGTVGAGTGATVAKLNGPQGAIKAGIGSGSEREGALVVGALFAVNAVGDVLGEDGEPIAASRGDAASESRTWPPSPGTNTVIGVVATNARLSKERAHLLAIAAHDAFASAVRPAHTLWDGDTVFTLATGEVQAAQDVVERLAEVVTARAIRRGVQTATTLAGVPAIAGGAGPGGGPDAGDGRPGGGPDADDGGAA